MYSSEAFFMSGFHAKIDLRYSDIESCILCMNAHISCRDPEKSPRTSKCSMPLLPHQKEGCFAFGF